MIFGKSKPDKDHTWITFDQKYVTERQWNFMSSLVEKLTEPQIKILLTLNKACAVELLNERTQESFDLYIDLHDKLYSLINIYDIEPNMNQRAFLFPDILSWDSKEQKYKMPNQDFTGYVFFVPKFVPKKKPRKYTASQLKQQAYKDKMEYGR